jgi:release factor glutamine methyltransferase
VHPLDSERRSVRQVLLWAARTLSVASIPSPRLDAEVLLAHVLGCGRGWLYARPEFHLTNEQREAFEFAVERRRCREPVPYIVGHREFYGLDFVVDARVLIPRPETELLVERAIEAATQMGRDLDSLALADVGTGSGAVAVSLAVALPSAAVYATDASKAALQVAALNAGRHGVAHRVHFLEGDLLGPLPQRMHVIAANVPYVPTELLATLASDVVEYEPLMALDGGVDGLMHLRRLLDQANHWLAPRGWLVLEIGSDQGKEVVTLASHIFPQANVELFQDYAGFDRIVRIQTL